MADLSNYADRILESWAFFEDKGDIEDLELEVWEPDPDLGQARRIWWQGDLEPGNGGEEEARPHIEDRVLHLPCDYYEAYGLLPLPERHDHPRSVPLTDPRRVPREGEVACPECGTVLRGYRGLPGHKATHTRRAQQVVPSNLRIRPPPPRSPFADADPIWTRYDDLTDLIECVSCGEVWLRERQRGRRPKFCDACRA